MARRTKPPAKQQPPAKLLAPAYLAGAVVVVAVLLGLRPAPAASPAASAPAAAKAGAARELELSEIDAHVRGLREEERAATACADASRECAVWAQRGECDANPGFMLRSCRASCGECGAALDRRGAAPARACADDNAMCVTWASIGECESNPSFMRAACRLSCRLCQTDSCRDTRDDCAARAARGGCYTRERMRDECGWTCMSCGLESSPRCARDRTAPPAAVAGSVEALFARLAAARPNGTMSVSVLSRAPWVVQLDDFVSAAEADALLAAGGAGWARSLAGDGVQLARTSSTSWCSKPGCLSDPTVKAVQDRIEALTEVPVRYTEYMQLLRYEPGQYYRRHHDQNSPRASAWGPRLYTFYMYLSDVEEGGGTHFPVLNLTVQPAKGRAVLWTSVLDDDPYERDDRTDHEALDVTAGVKYGANYWLHMFPFREESDRGCDNAQYAENWV